jgi:hypothetical protein
VTWIIGIPCGGLAIGLADTRVSRGHQALSNFGVKKLHQVGAHMAAGFSGSIELGFRMVGEMANYVSSVGGDPGADLSEWLSKWALAVGDRYKPDSEGWGARLVVLATSPSTKFGPPSIATGLFLSQGSIVRTPDLGERTFDVQPIPFMEARAIGSGSGVEAYMEVLSGVAKMETLAQLVNMHRALPGTAPALVIAFHLSRILETSIEPSVSQDLHLCVVDGRGITVQTNEEMSGRTMGPIATTWPEVVSLANADGIVAAELRG